MKSSDRKIVSRSQLDSFNILSRPIWIFDVEKQEIWWANHAATSLNKSLELNNLLSNWVKTAALEAEKNIQNYLLEAIAQKVTDALSVTRSHALPMYLSCTKITIETGKLAVLVEGNVDLASSQQLEAFHQTKTMISLFDSDGFLVMQNSAAKACYGNESNNVFQQRFVNSEVAERAKNCLNSGEIFRTEAEMRTHQCIRWHELELQPVKSSDCEDTSLLVSERNITERKQKELAIIAEKELAHLTLNSINDAIVTTDVRGKIKYFNTAAEKLSGWKSWEALGKKLTEVLEFIDETTRQPIVIPVTRVVREKQAVRLSDNTLALSRSGAEYAIDCSLSPLRATNGMVMGLVLTFSDITASRKLTRQLSWQASHDALTGLYNRQEFERRLQEAIARAKQNREHHVVCYLDLDRFKIINDTCGHVAGDELLRRITAVLQQRVRAVDVLARLGGDEFGLLLYQCSMEQAETTAKTLKQIIQNFRFLWEGKGFNIGVSIGLTKIDEYTTDLAKVLSEADTACYAAKESGRNCIRVYRVDDRELSRQRGETQWLLKIKKALAEDRFCLHCQKIVPVGGTVEQERYEILLRLRDDAERLVSPMAFIPAAERYGLMSTVDCWVISTFFAFYDTYWSRYQSLAGTSPSAIFTINLSAVTIDNPQFVNFITNELKRSRFTPEFLCFEITETSAIANLEKASRFITELREMGFCFALDDFGKGMSSFSYLKNLPVDYLKIDGSFVRDLDSDYMNFVIVESFNRIAHALGIKTITEFVENTQILNSLETIGIDYAQGYAIARPQPLDSLLAVSDGRSPPNR